MQFDCVHIHETHTHVCTQMSIENHRVIVVSAVGGTTVVEHLIK